MLQTDRSHLVHLHVAVKGRMPVCAITKHATHAPVAAELYAVQSYNFEMGRG